MNKALLCSILSSASLTLAIPTVCAANPRALIDEIVPVSVVLSRADALRLSPEQRASINAATAELQRETATLARRMREQNEELVALLKAAKPDETVVLAQFEKLAATETALKRARLLSSIRIKAILTPEQTAAALAFAGERERPAPVTEPAASEGNLASKLRRVKAGLEQWKREGRDVTRLRDVWEQFQEAEAKGRYGEARKRLDEALAILDAAGAPGSK